MASVTSLPSTDPSCVTFVFENEDHTLGNSLRFVLLKNKKVEFCGYTIPHPSEAKMHLRLQCVPPHTAKDVLREALEMLEGMCHSVIGQFGEALAAHEMAV